MTDSKTITKLRNNLVTAIPVFPNDRSTVDALKQKPLLELLLIYFNWSCRLIPNRPRKIKIDKEVKNDRRWSTLEPNIKALLKKAENGEDLLPFLSKRALSKGYTPIQIGSDTWEDKDQILNITGFYHFHL